MVLSCSLLGAHTRIIKPASEAHVTTTNGKTALITGANSGLGFEAAAQLASQGWDRVILACRTAEKAKGAHAALAEQVGRDPFEELALDVSDNAGVQRAVDRLGARGVEIDQLLLNAGLMSGSEVRRSVDGVELTMAASLVGHHVLTVGLLNANLLRDGARIVIAGSEAARNDVPMMSVTDVAKFADEYNAGDRAQAVLAISRAQPPYSFSAGPHYANVKAFVAHWAASLSRRLPEGMTVNAVSPGSTRGTNMAQHQSFLLRLIMSFMMKIIAPVFGLSASVGTAARRYVDALSWGPERNGQFYASVPGKMTGKVVQQTQPHILDHQTQEAVWKAVVELSDGAELARDVSVLDVAPAFATG